MRRGRVRGWSRCALVVGLLATAPLRAAPPDLEAVFPAGGQAGTTFTVTATGKVEADAKVWCSSPDISWVPTGKKREWTVSIAPGAAHGPHLIRAYNAEGASRLRWFAVGSLAEIAEKEPNDATDQPQVLEELPLCVNGRLDKQGDVDSFAMKLTAGATLTGYAECYSIGSPVDMVAHLLDGKGVRVGTFSDGRNLDPVISFTAPAAGPYTVQVSGFAHPPVADVRFTGGPTSVYRLHLTDAKVVTGILPAVVTTKGDSTVEAQGLASTDKKPARVTLPAMPDAVAGEVKPVTVAGALAPFQVLVAEQPGVAEIEPKDDFGKSMPVRIGDRIGGCLTKGDASDRFAFQATKGKRLTVRVLASEIGSPLDPVMEIADAGGKVLVEADDSGDNKDPTATWTVPADGEYTVAVRDRFGRGGEGLTYVLRIDESQPSFSVAVADVKPVELVAGKTATLKAEVKFSGEWKQPLICRAAFLPPGVSAADVAVPAKGGSVEVKLEAAASAPAYQGPFCVSVVASDGSALRLGVAALRGEDARGTSLLDQTHHLWLTVKTVGK